jgi:hypothetical protein
MPWESGMLRTSQDCLHALHDGRIAWVGDPLINPAIFGNSLDNDLAVAPHFVDPQVGHSDPDAHAFHRYCVALCKKSCGGIRNGYRRDEKGPRRRSGKGGALTNEQA